MPDRRGAYRGGIIPQLVPSFGYRHLEARAVEKQRNVKRAGGPVEPANGTRALIAAIGRP